MQTERNYCRRILKNVRITNFCRSNSKSSSVGETLRKNFRVVQRHGRTCSKIRCAILASKQTKKVKQFFKVSSLCLDGHQFKQEELESVGELSQVCSQIVLKGFYMARIERPDKMDSGMRQTIVKIDFIHSSHK